MQRHCGRDALIKVWRTWPHENTNPLVRMENMPPVENGDVDPSQETMQHMLANLPCQPLKWRKTQQWILLASGLLSLSRTVKIHKERYNSYRQRFNCNHNDRTKPNLPENWTENSFAFPGIATCCSAIQSTPETWRGRRLSGGGLQMWNPAKYQGFRVNSAEFASDGPTGKSDEQVWTFRCLH